MTISDKQAQDAVMTIGVRPGDADFDHMMDAAKRGWPAWRIAQAYALSAELIYKLGGPPPNDEMG